MILLDGSHQHVCMDRRPPCGSGRDLPGPSIAPQLRRTDYVQHSNDSAWMANPQAPLRGYSPLISQDGQPLGPRALCLAAPESAEHARCLGPARDGDGQPGVPGRAGDARFASRLPSRTAGAAGCRVRGASRRGISKRIWTAVSAWCISRTSWRSCSKCLTCGACRSVRRTRSTRRAG